uniref:SipW-dependent-type signal peptide-containing protein n=1 Tax=Acetatifactor sp. TaxID=1872090 RepID=UPI004057A710
MNKKKLLGLVVSLALVGAVGIGATLAYFTDREAEVNVITMGHVDVDLDEPNFDTPVDDPSTPDVDESEEEKDNTIEDVMPGQRIVKDPTITVAEGSDDAYIRAKVEFTGLTEEQADELLANINIDDTAWYLGEDGYYYYNLRMTAGDSAVLFDEVVIPETWGNEVVDLTFEILVSAEAIQADNFEPTIDENGMITAWTYSDGTAITAENYTVEAEEAAPQE